MRLRSEATKALGDVLSPNKKLFAGLTSPFNKREMSVTGSGAGGISTIDNEWELQQELMVSPSRVDNSERGLINPPVGSENTVEEVSGGTVG